jgi:hypothetical protein
MFKNGNNHGLMATKKEGKKGSRSRQGGEHREGQRILGIGERRGELNN